MRRTCTQDYTARGGKVLAPPGKPFNTPELLDGLDTRAVLRAVQLISESASLGRRRS